MQGVTIRLVNVDRGREVTLTTDKDGRFYRRGLQAVSTSERSNAGIQPVNDKIKLRHRPGIRLQAGEGRGWRSKDSRTGWPPTAAVPPIQAAIAAPGGPCCT